jgi:DeoR family transcriptional regulator, fructose operon transcriptional repressor
VQNQVQQRRERLLRLLRADTFASVESLSERLRVSALTVRRDLDTLQEAGLVERVHGGARALVEHGMDKSEISYYARRGAQVVEKQAIARAAVKLLEPEGVVVVDASTSGLYFARAIPRDLPLTLITYSAGLPVELAEHAGLQVICTGGLLHRKSLCYLGEDAERASMPYHAGQAFFGAKGVSLEAGCTDALLPEVRLKAALARQVEALVILADHTKLENVGLASFAALGQVHTLVTGTEADPRVVEAIRERGVRVILASLEEDAEL